MPGIIRLEHEIEYTPLLRLKNSFFPPSTTSLSLFQPIHTQQRFGLHSAVLIACYFLCQLYLNAQTTISWNGYTGGSISPYVFSTGTAPNNMQATITKNNCTLSDATPKYVASNPGAPCYIAGSLALNANFLSVLSSDNAHYTLTMTFNPRPEFPGTCNYAQFTIMDINANSSLGTFLDVLEISAVDEIGNAIVATTSNLALPAGGGITTTIPSNSTRSLPGGNILKLTGHNNSAETWIDGSRFSSNCQTTTVRVKPPDDALLGSITIKYRPGYGSNSGSTTYYNLNGPPRRPENQYVSISNITLFPHTTPSTCSILLPVELLSFTGSSMDRGNLLEWETATERDNSHFELERSTNGVEWEMITTVAGSGTSLQPISYGAFDTGFKPTINYYRLKQMDQDGREKWSNVIFIDNSLRTKTLEKNRQFNGTEGR